MKEQTNDKQRTLPLLRPTRGMRDDRKQSRDTSRRPTRILESACLSRRWLLSMEKSPPDQCLDPKQTI